MSTDAAAPSGVPAVFTQTQRLRAATDLINGLAVKRLPLILNRVLTHLKDQTESVFNSDELAQLTEVFSLSLEQIHTILDSMSYIYEQAAYHLLNGEKLQVQLTQVLQIAEPQSAAIAHVWNEQREAYMVNLRERSFGTPLLLSTVHTRSQVTLGTDLVSNRKDINTLLSIGLKREGDNVTSSAAPISVELSPAALQNLYDTLEQIQGQLDALSDKPQ